mgnify:CR=1 FL=1
MSKQRVVTWQSETATVTWDEDLCIHVGECTRAKGTLFESGRKPPPTTPPARSTRRGSPANTDGG